MERHTMKSIRVIALIIAVVALASIWLAGAAVAAASNSNYVPNEYIIHVTPGTAKTEVDSLAGKLGAVVVSKLALDDTYLIRTGTSNSLVSRASTSTHHFTATSWKIDYIQPNFLSKFTAIPNDEYWRNLWGMELIKMPQAWDLEKGDSSVIVAVNDSGVALHPDLVGRLLPGFNCIDDSANSQLDDVGHGTHVAGTIAGMGDNQIGVTGVCWEGVKILPIKIGDNTSITTANIIKGLDYAKQNGAKVVNMSYGGYSNDQAEHDKIKELAAAGIVLVAAAGNDEVSIPHYPSAWDECISVSAIGPTDALASYSNYGATIDIAAPGGDPSLRGLDSDQIFSTMYDIASDTYGYGYMSGTSMASPHVAGAAAILISHGVASSKVRARLLNTARPPTSGAMNSYKYGAGILDVYEALSESIKIVKPAKGGVVSSTPEFKIVLDGADPRTVKVYVDYADANRDGVPDYVGEIPMVDTANISNYGGAVSIDGDELTINTAALHMNPLSTDASANPHQVYVTAQSQQTGATLTDWTAFTVTNRVITKGIHLFAFPYSLPDLVDAPYRMQPDQILFDKQTGQPASFSLVTWIAKAYNPITGHLESRYAYFPNDYLAWTYPHDSMPDPMDPWSTLSWDTAGGYPVGPRSSYTYPAGAGFWLILPEDAVIADTTTLPTLQAPNGYTIRLYEGWNMIGNPYDHSVSWRALFDYRGATKTMQDAEAAGWIKSSLYGYRAAPTPGYYLLPERSMLEPYTGYWLKALVGGVNSYDSLKMTILP